MRAPIGRLMNEKDGIASMSLNQFNKLIKRLMRCVLPLNLRMRLCIHLNQHKWISSDSRYWWTRELLKDFAEHDRDEYHRFLWSNHLAYSLTYEVEQRFGESNIVASRRIFFDDLRMQLKKMAIDPKEDVASVFEVGCSLGYQLRYLETDIFTAATDISGIDIDRYAIEQGRRYLDKSDSIIQLYDGDMADLERILNGKQCDIFLCTGVLMYMAEEDAARVLKKMLDHCRTLVALSDPGNPQYDNGRLEHSLIREHDGSHFHNLDAMVESAGGHVLYRRWQGARMVDGQRLYFVFAAK